MPSVWALPRSLATTCGIDCFLYFPPVTEMFHFTGSCVSFPILFRKERPPITEARLPHSEISGSTRICRSPKLIAAYHVLHRLLAPRHSLCALYNLISPALLKPAKPILNVRRNFPGIIFSKSVDVSVCPSGQIFDPVSFSFITQYAVVKEPGFFLAESRAHPASIWLVCLNCVSPVFNRFAVLLIHRCTGGRLRTVVARCNWWTQLDLNQRPPPYQGGALTN